MSQEEGKKKELLQNLEESLKSGLVKIEDIQILIDSLDKKGKTNSNSTLVDFNAEETSNKNPLSFVKTVSILGVSLIFLGLFYFIVLFWYRLEDFGRILMTFGLAIVVHLLADYLTYINKTSSIIAKSIYFLASLLLSVGALIIGNSVSVIGNKLLPWSYFPGFLMYALIFLFTTIFYTWTSYLGKSNLLTATALVHGSFCYWFLAFFLLLNYLDFSVQMFDFLGVFYSLILITLGRILSIKAKKIQKALRFFEGLGYLLLFFYTWSTFSKLSPDVFSAVVFVLGIAIAFKTPSVTLLNYSFLAILGYILYLNARYFSYTDFWPIALVISGLFLIAIAYVYAKFKKRLNSPLSHSKTLP